MDNLIALVGFVGGYLILAYVLVTIRDSIGDVGKLLNQIDFRVYSRSLESIEESMGRNRKGLKQRTL